ncbi:MAG: hypothetical protein QM606_06595, partial [Leucobacter sp.]
HALAFPEAVASPAGWNDVLEGLFTRGSLKPLGYTLLYGLAAICYAPALWGADFGIRFVLLQLVVTYATVLLTRRLWDSGIARLDWRWRASVFSAISFCAAAGVVLLTMLFSPLFSQRLAVHICFLGAIGVAAGWIYSACFSLRSSLRQLDAQIVEAENALHEERVRLHTLVRAETRAIARFLHGPVQDALSAAAFRVRAALASEEPAPNLMSEVQGSIRASIDRLPSVSPGVADASEVLTQIAELWRGVAEVTWTFDEGVSEGLANDRATRSSFNELVREACSNAVRHGNATRIEVRAEAEARAILLTVRNTGEPVKAHAGSGLGSRLFEELTLSWRRSATSDGTVVEARLPLIA